MTAVEDVVNAELVVVDHNLFRAATPAEVIVAAEAMARPLGDLIRGQNMVTRIGKGEHSNIEGWQTAGAMLGISAHTVWSRPVPDLPDDVRGWEARAEARTRTGEIVGAAEGMVDNSERNWRGATDQAMRSMAQTRAQSKALASVLRFVMTLTGVKGTPLEEVEGRPERDAGAGSGGPSALPAWAAPVANDTVSAVAAQLVALLNALGVDEDADREVMRLGQAIFDSCGDSMPVAVANTIGLLAAYAVPATDAPVEDAVEAADASPGQTTLDDTEPAGEPGEGTTA